jgi:hypothetical protein
VQPSLYHVTALYRPVVQFAEEARRAVGGASPGEQAPGEGDRLRRFLDQVVQSKFLPRLEADLNNRVQQIVEGPLAFQPQENLAADPFLDWQPAEGGDPQHTARFKCVIDMADLLRRVFVELFRLPRSADQYLAVVERVVARFMARCDEHFRQLTKNLYSAQCAADPANLRAMQRDPLFTLIRSAMAPSASVEHLREELEDYYETQLEQIHNALLNHLAHLDQSQLTFDAGKFTQLALMAQSMEWLSARVAQLSSAALAAAVASEAARANADAAADGAAGAGAAGAGGGGVHRAGAAVAAAASRSVLFGGFATGRVFRAVTTAQAGGGGGGGGAGGGAVAAAPASSLRSPLGAGATSLTPPPLSLGPPQQPQQQQQPQQPQQRRPSTAAAAAGAAGAAGAASRPRSQRRLEERAAEAGLEVSPQLEATVAQLAEAVARMSDLCLFVLRLELQSHCLYFLANMQSASYELAEAPTQPEAFVAELNRDLTAAELELSKVLPPDKVRYLFDGVSYLQTTFMMRTLPHLRDPRVNEKGVACIERNLLALQQNLTNIVVGLSDAHFDRARAFFALLRGGPEQLAAAQRDHPRLFSKDELAAIRAAQLRREAHAGSRH